MTFKMPEFEYEPTQLKALVKELEAMNKERKEKRQEKEKRLEKERE